MGSKVTIQEARAAQVGFKALESADYYRVVPANHGVILADGSTYMPRAVALVPRHGNDEAEFHLAMRIANMLQAEQ